MYNWHSLLGRFSFSEEEITFLGGTTELLGRQAAEFGSAISDQRFSGGVIRGTFRFREISQYSACQLIISYQPTTGAFVTAGIGADRMFMVGLYHNGWNYYAVGGNRDELRSV